MADETRMRPPSRNLRVLLAWSDGHVTDQECIDALRLDAAARRHQARREAEQRAEVERANRPSWFRRHAATIVAVAVAAVAATVLL